MKHNIYDEIGLVQTREFTVVSGTLRYIVKDAAGATITDRVATAAEQAAYNAETAALLAATNRKAIDDKVALALDTNNTYLALASPTNAQVVAQVRALTKEVNGLIRLQTERLQSSADV